ncbi:MAG: arginine--tRNA ligase [Candidatus Kerfeldbacteria bacterium]|nr:arginine--tRNA ligase [Candidatus Kerfeldbacteria bacterium]
MKDSIQKDIQEAIIARQQSGDWPVFDIPPLPIDLPELPEHGDFASNIAMQLARVLKKPPLMIAEELKQHLLAGDSAYADIQVAPPGFLNFFLSTQQYAESLKQILRKKEAYGRSSIGKRKKVLVEFLSANPTGPLTLPNGRGGYLGDVLSNILAATGFTVLREYYMNDRGKQVEVLGESVMRRYLQNQGIKVDYADELYQGEYISELATKLALKDYKLNHGKKAEWIRQRITVLALRLMIADIKRVVEEKMQIHYDNWFSEKSLYDDGVPEKMLAKLREAGNVYEQNGALWVRTSAYGDDKDRVIVKSTGDGAYMQGDIALFYDRAFRRHVRKVVLILGADHHGYEHRLKAVPKLLNADTEFDILFTQMVTLIRDGKEMRMSKRQGNFVTIEELIDEVGNDAARFFFLLYSANSHMNFDLGLAKEQSDKNPVYYVQYAHARMCSILREVGQLGAPPLKGLLVEHAAEKALLKELMVLPELLKDIARTYEVHRLPTYALDLARSFHHFYGQCRVIDNGEVQVTRYALVVATQTVLHSVLKLLGVSAPEKM